MLQTKNGLTMTSRKTSKDTLKQMKQQPNSNQNPIEHSEDNPKREIYSNTGLSQKKNKKNLI